MDWQKIYEQYNAGDLKPNDLNKHEWYQLAGHAAVKGKPEIKNEIYDEVIPKHKHYSDEDKARVKINRLDLQRRQGQIEEALENLLKIGKPEDGIALIEWLQAAGECKCRLGPQQLNESIEMARQALLLSKAIEQPDKKIYRLTTLTGRKLRAEQIDKELIECLDSCEELLEQETDTNKYYRSVGYYLNQRGLVSRAQEDTSSSLQFFLA